VELFTVKPGVKFNLARLKEYLPTTELVLFFGKLYDLNAMQLSQLLAMTHDSTLAEALLVDNGSHSHDLQDYLLEIGYERWIDGGELSFDKTEPEGVLLPEVWKSLEVEIAKSIKDVAAKLATVVAHMPGKQGHMVFNSMMVMNAKRPILGDYRAAIQHDHQADNLVVLDVSGSMTEDTVRTIIEDVVAMSYMANAHLAIVSDTATVWGPGEYNVDTVLEAAEYSGTHYEALANLFEGREWGVVVTIADYDSSRAAMDAFRQVDGSIEKLLDISLVERPTYLSEVLGTQAKDREQLLVAASYWACR
jgi:hypothetical protein